MSGLITDLGQLNDNGFNELAFKGLQRAERELGVKGRVVESRSAADYVPNMASLARQGYDLIIGVGFAQGDAIATAAQRFPKVKFAIVDVDQSSLKGKPTNVEGLLFREEQVGYLVGYLAALTAKREGDDTISAVGGFKEPPVDRFIAGYEAGAEAAVPGTTVLHAYSQDWEDQAKCKELALDQIARGLRRRLPGRRRVRAGRALGGEGPQSLGDRRRRRPVVPRAARAHERAQGRRLGRLPHRRRPCRTARWKGGGNAVFGLDQEGVGLGKVSPKAAKDDVDAVERGRVGDRERRDRRHPDDASADRGRVLSPRRRAPSTRAAGASPPSTTSRRRRPTRTRRPTSHRSRARAPSPWPARVERLAQDRQVRVLLRQPVAALVPAARPRRGSRRHAPARPA